MIRLLVVASVFELAAWSVAWMMDFQTIALGGASLEVTFAKEISGKIAPIEKAAQGPASLATPAADSQHKPGLNL